MLALLMAKGVSHQVAAAHAADAQLLAQICAVLPKAVASDRCYTIGPGDCLIIESGTERFFEYLVDSDGNATIGVFGTFQVAGLTVNEVQAALTAHASRCGEQPKLSVEVSEFNPAACMVYVHDGKFNLQPAVRLAIADIDRVFEAMAQVERANPTTNAKVSFSRGSGAGRMDFCVILGSRGSASWPVEHYGVQPGDIVSITTASRTRAWSSGWEKVSEGLEWCLSSLAVSRGS
jgi:protein involved in polysaccharide export with SLBB domain